MLRELGTPGTSGTLRRRSVYPVAARVPTALGTASRGRHSEHARVPRSSSAGDIGRDGPLERESARGRAGLAVSRVAPNISTPPSRAGTAGTAGTSDAHAQCARGLPNITTVTYTKLAEDKKSPRSPRSPRSLMPTAHAIAARTGASSPGRRPGKCRPSGWERIKRC
jgi:hypothetical protein